MTGIWQTYLGHELKECLKMYNLRNSSGWRLVEDLAGIFPRPCQVPLYSFLIFHSTRQLLCKRVLLSGCFNMCAAPYMCTADSQMISLHLQFNESKNKQFPLVETPSLLGNGFLSGIQLKNC